MNSKLWFRLSLFPWTVLDVRLWGQCVWMFFRIFLPIVFQIVFQGNRLQARDLCTGNLLGSALNICERVRGRAGPRKKLSYDVLQQWPQLILGRSGVWRSLYNCPKIRRRGWAFGPWPLIGCRCLLLGGSRHDLGRGVTVEPRAIPGEGFKC